jgi:hypothetical protein
MKNSIQRSLSRCSIINAPLLRLPSTDSLAAQSQVTATYAEGEVLLLPYKRQYKSPEGANRFWIKWSHGRGWQQCLFQLCRKDRLGNVPGVIDSDTRTWRTESSRLDSKMSRVYGLVAKIWTRHHKNTVPNAILHPYHRYAELSVYSCLSTFCKHYQG